MKYASLRAFEQHLQEASSGNFCPVYLLISKEELERKEAERALLQALLQGEQENGRLLRSFRGENTSASQVMSELSSLSFFEKCRVILVRNMEALPKDACQQLEAYVDSPYPSVYLLLTAASLHRGTKFYKSVEKAGIILDIQEEKPWEKEQSLIEKIIGWAAAHQKKITSDAARFLVQHLGTDQLLLYHEVEKLICFTGQQEEITADDIAAVCTKVNTKNFWQLSEAVFQRNGSLALAISASLLQEGVAIFSLLRQLRSQFQIKLRLLEILLSGGGEAEVQHVYPYLKGRLFQQNAQLAKLYGAAGLKKGILTIDETEMMAKNSAVDEELLLQRCLAKLILEKPL